MTVEWVALITVWWITGALFTLAVGCLISFREPEELHVRRLRMMCAFMFPPVLLMRWIKRIFIQGRTENDNT